MSAKVSIPSGSSVPGCEATNECYIPAEVTIGIGGTVTWTNDDTAAHTVTSGNINAGGPDGVFDSSIFMAGKTFEHTFDEAGEYDYFCIVHPWMTGKVIVE
ncbi:cupredoxin domain-containing protein [Candidatus Nitrosotenuis uzonensis]|nr:plastocyanin/azurin family copper-binding protein [Candidatus Nitrosotenuis uzonensis]